MFIVKTICVISLCLSLTAYGESIQENNTKALDIGRQTKPMMNSRDWVSDIDEKYMKQNPSLYKRVNTAKSMINISRSRDFSEQAMKLLNEVLKEDPSFAPAYVQLARATSNLGDLGGNVISNDALKKQEQFLKSCLKLEPDYDYALAMMGYTKMFQGDLVEAEKYYLRAYKMGSKYPYLGSQMAQLAIRKKDYDKAISLAEQGMSQYKGEPKIASAYVKELSFAYSKMANVRLFQYEDYDGAIRYGDLAYAQGRSVESRSILVTAHLVKWAYLKAIKADQDILENEITTALSYWHPSQDMMRRLAENAKLKSAGEEIAAEMSRRNIEVYGAIEGENGSIIYLRKAE